MKSATYLGHFLQKLYLVLLGLVAAAMSILPISAFVWLIFTWDHVEAYAPAVALMLGMTVSALVVLTSKSFPHRSINVVSGCYGTVMLFFLGYAIFVASIPEKKPFTPLSAEESRAFEIKEECRTLKRRYREGAMAAFEGRSSPYGDIVIPSHCRNLQVN
ncbi:hypothetical protein HG264_01170 [Pseudomonas sp. gcc21]|uniref:hypothetical protein n=1 Tax=Pseudomonas sp. gcc21 TaxID=2726989 RepID=UPI0014520731|nr:hypothetical protein [Pseudomonas sp. gcc21]QJD57615.1 hypothetical protein HG264_01170 [Pseudomonas sp. gcc21]